MPRKTSVSPDSPEDPSPESGVSRFREGMRVLTQRRNLTKLIGLIALIAIGTSIYFYMQYDMLRKNPNALQEKEVAALVEEVGKLILLPEETPTVATVLDTAALAEQPFFVNAATGDKVLVFVSARQAILYRPSEHKIINVAPLHLEGSAAQQVQIPETTPEEPAVEEVVTDETAAE